MMETFWKTIELYNMTTWPLQILMIAAGFAAVMNLAFNRKEWSGTVMKAYLVILYLWIAIVYYQIFCSEREHSNLMSAFWMILAVSWIWDMAKGNTVFTQRRKYRILSTVLMLVPFLYPAMSVARGLEFPGMTTPVMPCTAVVFTIGVLLMFSEKANLFIVLMLCHWTVIGLSKAIYYDMTEDYLMAFTSLPAVYLFFRDRYLADREAPAKPCIECIGMLLAAVCVSIFAILAVSVYRCL